MNMVSAIMIQFSLIFELAKQGIMKPKPRPRPRPRQSLGKLDVFKWHMYLY